jgi:energy-coupling factor transporter ATP-binding protein EcfA2
MLKYLHLRNFTVFADAEFEFGEGLNVLVGVNGTGKTHVLKAGYVLAQNFQKGATIDGMVFPMFKFEAQYLIWLMDKISKVFKAQPHSQEELIRHHDYNTEVLLESRVSSQYKDVVRIVTFAVSSGEMPNVESIDALSANSIINPVFLPAKEVLTSSWILPLYDRREIPIDETYPDLLRLLSGPPLRQPEPAHIVEKLAQLIGGKVEEEGGHFYLATENQPRLEMNLVAEGMRKFATLYKLLANGTLTPETTLFWDEPEANLNPALLKDMAAILTDLAQAGFQIILATHSLFLMRELHILAQQKKKPVRYFGLYKGEEGDVRVERKDDLMQLQHLVALDAELAQTFDFEAALDEDYAGDN